MNTKKVKTLFNMISDFLFTRHVELICKSISTVGTEKPSMANLKLMKKLGRVCQKVNEGENPITKLKIKKRLVINEGDIKKKNPDHNITRGSGSFIVTLSVTRHIFRFLLGKKIKLN